jgi:hypothetical protein|tara:strand:- start:8011 stop:8214 length:204 start_codon:yes stop_codon:yes gene_type:complete
MSEKPNVDFKRFQPKKMHSKYWIKFLLYCLIIGALIFWYKEKAKNKVTFNQKVDRTQVDLKGVKIEE